MANPQPQTTNTPFDFKTKRLVGCAPALRPFQMGAGVMSRCKNYTATQNGLRSFGVAGEALSFSDSLSTAFTVYGTGGEAYCVVSGTEGTWFKALYQNGPSWTEIVNKDGNPVKLYGGVESVADACTYYFSAQEDSGNYALEAKTKGTVTARTLGLRAPEPPIYKKNDPGFNIGPFYRPALSFAQEADGVALLESGAARPENDDPLEAVNFNGFSGTRWYEFILHGAYDADENWVAEEGAATNLRFWRSAELYSVSLKSGKYSTDYSTQVGTADQLYLLADVPFSDFEQNGQMEYEFAAWQQIDETETYRTYKLWVKTDSPEIDNLGDAVGIDQINLSPIPPSSFGAYVKDRLFVLDNANPTYVAYSAQQGTAYREQMNALQRIEVPGAGNVVCFGPINDDLAILTEDECYVVPGSDPANGCQFLAKHGSMGKALFSAGRGVFVRTEDGAFQILAEASLSFVESYNGVDFSNHMGTVLSENDRTTVAYSHPDLQLAFAEGMLFISRATAREKNRNFVLNYDEGMGWTELDIQGTDLKKPFDMDGRIAWLGSSEEGSALFTSARAAQTEFAIPLADENGFVRADSCDLLAALDNTAGSPSLIVHAHTDYGRWGDGSIESSNAVKDSLSRWYRFVLPRNADKMRPCGHWMEIVFESQQPQQADIFTVGVRGLVLNPWMHPGWDPRPKDTASLTFVVNSVSGLAGHSGAVEARLSGDGYEEKEYFGSNETPKRLRFSLRRGLQYKLSFFFYGTESETEQNIAIQKDTLLSPVDVVFPLVLLTAPVGSVTGLAGQKGAITATLAGNGSSVQKTFESADVPKQLEFTIVKNTDYVLSFAFGDLAATDSVDVNVDADTVLDPITPDFGLALLTATVETVTGLAGQTGAVTARMVNMTTPGDVKTEEFYTDNVPTTIEFTLTKGAAYELSFAFGVDLAETTETINISADMAISLDVAFSDFLLTAPINSVQNGNGSTVYAVMKNTVDETEEEQSFEETDVPKDLTFTLSKNVPYTLGFLQEGEVAETARDITISEDTTLPAIDVVFEYPEPEPADWLIFTVDGNSATTGTLTKGEKADNLDIYVDGTLVQTWPLGIGTSQPFTIPAGSHILEIKPNSGVYTGGWCDTLRFAASGGHKSRVVSVNSYPLLGFRKSATVDGVTQEYYNLKNAFAGFSKLEKIVDLSFSDSIDLVGPMQGMFSNCTKLKKAPKLIFSENSKAKRVDSSAFYQFLLNCSSLTSVPDFYIPNVTSLGTNSFCEALYRCSSLAEAPVVHLPKVEELGGQVFQSFCSYCSKMTVPPKIILAQTVNFTGSGNFQQFAMQCTALPSDYSYRFLPNAIKNATSTQLGSAAWRYTMYEDTPGKRPLFMDGTECTLGF
jgi:hypothetical protein